MFKKFIFLTLLLPSLLFAMDTSPFGQHFNLNNQGLNFSADNGNFKGNLSGWLFYDVNYFQNNQNDLPNGGHPQQIYTIATLSMYQNWLITIDANWAQPLILQNLNLSYLGNGFSWLVGQFDPDFGLDNSAVSPYSAMINTALPVQAINPPYGVGAQLLLNNKHWSWVGGIAGPQIAVDYQGHSPVSFTSRLLYVPLHESSKVIHFGLSLWQQYPSGSHLWGFAAIPEVFSNSKAVLLSTGIINNVQSISNSDIETAFNYHSYNLQGEYFLSSVNRFDSQPHTVFRGYYITGGYFLTGENKTYSYPGGFFSGISKIRHSYGAWQVTSQFSHLNLNSANVLGGEENNLSVGLNWYPSQNVAVRSEVIHVWAKLPVVEQNYSNNIYALRLILQC